MGGRLIIGSPHEAAALSAERRINGSTRATRGFANAFGKLFCLVDMAVEPGLRRPAGLHVADKAVEIAADADEFLEKRSMGQ